MRRVVVIGAGAAGTMAAIHAAEAGAETLLLERTRDGGRKILISGGGRCNVLPATLDERRFVTDSSPNTLRKLVRSWPLDEQVAFFEREVGTPLVIEQESAKRFPASHRARDVRDGLLALARRRGAQLRMETLVTDLTPAEPSAGHGWTVSLADGAAIEADAVIVATGGLSVPNTGSDGTGLRLLQRLGHTLHATYAALTPVTADPAPFARLSGISLPVQLTAHSGERTAMASGGFLFTHRGYSGPSVLDVSHVLVRARAARAAASVGGVPARTDAPLSAASLRVRWTAHDEVAWESLLRPQAGRSLTSVLRAELPDRLASALLDAAGVEATRLLADLTRDERRRLVEMLVRGELPWSGDEGYRKAEVTGGGVSLAEIDPRTMESRVRPGPLSCAGRCWTPSGPSVATTFSGRGRRAEPLDWARRGLPDEISGRSGGPRCKLIG